MTTQERSLHELVHERLAGQHQRYPRSRKQLVAILYRAARPLTVTEIIDAFEGTTEGRIPLSSAYRNLTVLEDAGVVHRIAGIDDTARYELAEDVHGEHHHHIHCTSCGAVLDISVLDDIEHAIERLQQRTSESTGVHITSHRIDFFGICQQCQQSKYSP